MVVRQKTTLAQTVPWWLWPNILSLDAPVVTLVWQWWFARVFAVSLSAAQGVTLFAAVWLIYAADHWLDAGKLDTHKPHLPRHGFYKKYRWRVAALWLAVFVTTALIALGQLDKITLECGLILLGCCVLYFLGVHVFPRVATLLTKEIQIAFVLCAGVTLVVWSHTVVATLLSFDFVLLALSFALLVFLNCGFIGLWEKPFDRAQQFVSVARHSRLEPALVSLSALLLVVSCFLSFWQPVFSVIALATLGLLALNYFKTRLSTLLLRVLADGVLLTPLLYLLLRHG